MAKKGRKKAKGVTISRGKCRVVKGRVRICVSRGGKLSTSIAPTRRKKRKSTKRKSSGKKKLKKPKSCKTKPAVRKGTCKCKTKAGKTKKLRIAYCRKPKR